MALFLLLFFLSGAFLFGDVPFSSGETPPAGMVKVKGGCFEMGDTFGDGLDAERPPHMVCVDDFYLDRGPVTQQEYQRVVGVNPSDHGNCPACPVERVNWYEAVEYCAKVGKRLPTEAEWEYAAREGGKKVRYGTGKNGISDKEANFDKRRGFFGVAPTVPVGSYPPNALGFYDMAGNVWEWVNDLYGENYYSHSSLDNPRGPASGRYHILRGGSWANNAFCLRATYRNISGAEYRYKYGGCRCAR